MSLSPDEPVVTAISVEERVGSPDITVVVPCYREVDNVEPLVCALEDALTGRDWEVIFVDDNSPDGTIDVIRRLARTNWRVRGICRIGRKDFPARSLKGSWPPRPGLSPSWMVTSSTIRPVLAT